MKIIQLWSPWSHAIACGLKSVETRGWHTPYRGPLLIAATQRWDGEMRAFWRSLMGAAASVVGWEDPRMFRYRDPPRCGAVVAMCQMANCWGMEFGASGEPLGWCRELPPLERAFGDYAPGRFGLMLVNVRALPEPIPFRGRQGKLLDAPAELVEGVEAQLGMGGPVPESRGKGRGGRSS